MKRFCKPYSCFILIIYFWDVLSHVMVLIFIGVCLMVTLGSNSQIAYADLVVHRTWSSVFPVFMRSLHWGQSPWNVRVAQKFKESTKILIMIKLNNIILGVGDSLKSEVVNHWLLCVSFTILERIFQSLSTICIFQLYLKTYYSYCSYRLNTSPSKHRRLHI